MPGLSVPCWIARRAADGLVAAPWRAIEKSGLPLPALCRGDKGLPDSGPGYADSIQAPSEGDLVANIGSLGTPAGRGVSTPRRDVAGHNRP